MNDLRYETRSGEPTVAEIIQGCIDGNDQSKAIFYDRYAGLVRRAVRRELARNGGSTADEEDFCHQIFERLFEEKCRRLATLSGAQVLNAWLVTVTRNYVSTQFRSRIREERSVQEFERQAAGSQIPTPERAAMDAERREGVEACLRELDPKDRLILELYFTQGLRYATIAEILHLNINTVASRLRRAKHKLLDTYRKTEHV